MHDCLQDRVTVELQVVVRSLRRLLGKHGCNSIGELVLAVSWKTVENAGVELLQLRDVVLEETGAVIAEEFEREVPNEDDCIG